jgi:hypothetical protein
MLEKPTDLEATFEPNFNISPMKIKIPQEMVDHLNEVCDNLVESDETDYSPYLVGQITNGKQIGIDFEKVDRTFLEFLYETSRTYIWNCLKKEDLFNQFDIRLGKLWMVSQLEHDFNPVHSHTGVLAGIIYTKVPSQIDLETLNGCLSFIYGDYHFSTLRMQGVRNIKPEVGDMYIFPAWMLHCVYPFTGEGERRCVAYNFYNAKIT